MYNLSSDLTVISQEMNEAMKCFQLQQIFLYYLNRIMVMIQLKHYTVKRLCLKIIEKRPKFAVSGKGELGSFVPIIANHETSTMAIIFPLPIPPPIPLADSFFSPGGSLILKNRGGYPPDPLPPHLWSWDAENRVPGLP